MIDDDTVWMDESPRCVVCHVTIMEEDGGLCDPHKYDEQPWPIIWHDCHFCGTSVNRGGYDPAGQRHWLSDCRPDLTAHEPGPLCTWGPNDCYVDHDAGKDRVYDDGPTW